LAGVALAHLRHQHRIANLQVIYERALGIFIPDHVPQLLGQIAGLP
jgi:hypothetical protein